MTWRRLLFICSVTLVLSGILAATGAGASAGIDAQSVSATSYTVGSVVSAPGTAHISDTVTFTGTGYLANQALEVGIIGRTDTDFYSALLASATSDNYGNWSAQVTVPASVERESDKASVPTLYGNWTVLGIADGSDGGIYGTTGALTIVESFTTAPTDASYNPSSVQSATLPNTGVPTAAPWLTGSGLLAGVGLALDHWRTRRRRQVAPPK